MIYTSLDPIDTLAKELVHNIRTPGSGRPSRNQKQHVLLQEEEKLKWRDRAAVELTINYDSWLFA